MSERALFEAALEIQDPVRRSAYLDEACQGKPELRASVDALLNAHEEAGSFLNVAAIKQLKSAPARPLDQTIDHSVSKTVPKDDDDEEDEYSLGFLEPSTKPGSIGRLSHYEVLQVLGKGGFGTVLKAFDEKLHRMVAIKVMDPQMAATSPPRKRFLREARAAAAIRHENIVQVYGVEEQPLPYLVMEFVDGKTLQQRQSGFGPLDIAEVLHIGRQIASGLAAAHAMGLIHRDIKPANILLENGVEQKIKITDFGLARTADDASLTVSGMIAGTPMYMAPEQATGQTLDHRADLFSLGSVLYQITSGRPPFRAPTTVAVLRRVVEDAPRPIQEIIPEAPDWLVAIISKLHAKNPDDRFQSAKEVADLLARCQGELRNPGGEKLPSELIETITLYKQNLPAPKPSWWFSSTKNLLSFAGTLLLFVTLSAGIIWWGGKLTGLSARTLHGLLAAVTGLVAIGGWGAEYFFNRRRAEGIAHTCASVAAAACLLAAGNGFMMRLVPKAQTPIAQAVPNATASVPAVTSTGWQGWPEDAPKAAIAPFDAAQAKKHQEEWAAYLKVPVEYTNSIGMKFRLIPPGEYLRGSGAEAAQVAVARNIAKQVPPDNIASETPQHKVILTKALYLGVHEVTQGQYEQMVGKNPAWHCAKGNGKDAVAGLNTQNFPIEHISWNDATEFCTKLDQREHLSLNYLRIGGTVRLLEGNGYRLPTEAEWEFACRAGTATEFWNGEDVSVVAQTAWFFDNSSMRTHAVGELAANPFGLYDMQGNVWEWCNGLWDPSEYMQYQQKTVVDPVTLLTAEHRAFRGGRFSGYVNDCRSAARCGGHQAFAGVDVGFRVTLSVEGVRAAIKATATAPASRPEAWQGWPADAPKAAIAPFDAAQAKKHQEEWAAYLKVPVEYTNSIGMKFRLIPPGEYLRGSGEEMIQRLIRLNQEKNLPVEGIAIEAPQHRVILTKAIYVGIHEVTQEQYEKVVGKNPAWLSTTGNGKELAAALNTRNHPVETVSWNDATEFCAKLSQREQLLANYLQIGALVRQLDGNGYRLPTEAEWEFACRAGTTTAYWSGDGVTDLARAGWFDENSSKRTHAVGELAANPFGLYDTHGNVWEWCHNNFDGNEYTQYQQKSAVDPGESFNGDTRSFRGGRSIGSDNNCRSALRAYGHNLLANLDVGFRVTLSVEGVRAAIKTKPAVVVSPPKGWPDDAPRGASAPFDAAQAKKHQEAWAAYLKVPVEFTNSIGMKFRLIPPGEFTMGMTKEETELLAGESNLNESWPSFVLASSPAHRVLLTQPYYLGTFEVTQEQYEKVLGSNPSFFSPVGEAKELAKGIDTREFPVDKVCVIDAAEFCIKLSQQEKISPVYSQSGNVITQLTGNGYRLPTEAEWEGACRAGTTTAWSHGSQGSELPVVGDRTHQTGILKSNPYGLFDMHGNTVEWCQDWYDALAYSQRGPGVTIDPQGPSTGTTKVGRGTYALHPEFPTSRSGARGGVSIDYRARGHGFRVLLSIDGARAVLKGNLSAATAPTVKVKMNLKDWPADAPNPAVAPFDAKQATKHQEEWAEYLKVPMEYKNKLGMTFVLIPPGVFKMGITNEEVETLSMLKPNDPAWKASLLASTPAARQVVISKPYYLGMYEVTQEEYAKVMGNNPSAFATNGLDKQKVVGEDTKRYPVEMVMFIDAVNFCLRLSEQDRLKPAYQVDGDNVTLATGNGYRLPTEAQWEFACRAGTTTPWFFGNQESELGGYAWFDRNSEGRSHFVGTVKSNPFDLFDMTGNVWEWCQDWYHPQGGMSTIDPLGPETGQARILRGADWASGSLGCSSSNRGHALTGVRDRNGGFRASLSVEAVREKLKVAGSDEAGKK